MGNAVGKAGIVVLPIFVVAMESCSLEHLDTNCSRDLVVERVEQDC
jgi:hypothetical protein